uniref:AAA+ ATPase domain-containing protein n=1 Tax=Zea mays TaxID=4577 RepID=A0A804LSG4_MAIZE
MEMVGGSADAIPGLLSYGWAGLWSTLASLLFLWSMVQDHLPFQLEEQLSALARRALAAVTPYVTITIDEHDADSFGRSEAYLAAEAYLGATFAGRASRLRAELPGGSDRVSLVVDDLDMFRDGRDYYASVGKAWKRGYLLFGPPGTGKSTMIAAMANYLGYDIYDLELTAVKSNTELRKLFIETKSKSIIVIEDIDCSIDLTGKRKKKKKDKNDTRKKKKKAPWEEEDKDEGSKVTLSGLLNFIDGLWSACGGERIIVFTTNHKDKLDPALIRRGRMDMHIEMSYCCFQGFKVLAKNYLGVQEHDGELFGDIRRLLEEVDMTPADVAENLMPRSKTKDADACLRRLVKALEEAKEAALLAAKAKQLDGIKDDEGTDDEDDSDDDGSVTSRGHPSDGDEKSAKKEEM